MTVTYMCQELKLKDKECERLAQVRNQLEQELEELTASLFEVGIVNQPDGTHAGPHCIFFLNPDNSSTLTILENNIRRRKNTVDS